MSSRDKSVFGVVLLLVLAVGGFFLIVAPKHHQATQLQAQIVTARTALTQAEAQVQAGVGAERQYTTYAKQLKSIRAAVPSDTQIPELINELQSASSKNKVGFQAVSVSDSSAATPTTPTTPTTGTTGTTTTSFPGQSFGLTFTGGYFAVANLIGTLSSYVHADDKHFKASGRLISISAVSLAPAGSGTSGATATSGNVTASTSGDVTASVTALDYDVPASLLSGSLTATPSTTTP